MGTFEDNAKGQPTTKIPLSAWKVLAVLSSLATMVMYAETMLIPALPDLIHEFSVPYNMSSWILSAYLIPGAVMTPIAGKLSDIYGRRKILLLVMAVYALGIAMAGFADNIYLLFVSRAIQGIGISMFVIAFSIIRDQFPREKISIGQGIISSMFASGAVLGLLMGGFIVSNFGWRATFMSSIPITIALFITIWRFKYSAKPPPDNMKPRSSRTVDIKGAITLAVFVTSFLVALTLVETEEGFGRDKMALFLSAGGISLAVFLIIERRSKEPLVELRLIAHKIILPANIIIMFVGFSMFMVFQTIPVLVRNPVPFGFGGDATAVSYIQLPFAIVLLVFGPTSGLIVSRLGSIKPIIMGTAITTAGFFGLVTFHQDWIAVTVNLAILSTGLSLTNVGAMNVTILATPPEFTGMSLGMNNLMRILGSSIGPTLAGVYMQTFHSTLQVAGTRMIFPSMQAYSIIFLTAMALSIFSVALALFLRRKTAQMSIPNLTR
ncbi:MAG: MFS transporter [Thermoproteota archaeon]|nr:MFS transporter [Thermoproteota archaeon]